MNFKTNKFSSTALSKLVSFIPCVFKWMEIIEQKRLLVQNKALVFWRQLHRNSVLEYICIRQDVSDSESCGSFDLLRAEAEADGCVDYTPTCDLVQWITT